MAIPVTVGTGPPPPGAVVGQTAGGFGAFMNAMGLVGLGPPPGAAAHNHHNHPPAFTAVPAPAPAPAAGNGGAAANGATPAAPAVTATWEDVDDNLEDEGGALLD
jgi:hypothetical protein